jgi:hypothetical protein
LFNTGPSKPPSRVMANAHESKSSPGISMVLFGPFDRPDPRHGLRFVDMDAARCTRSSGGHPLEWLHLRSAFCDCQQIDPPFSCLPANLKSKTVFEQCLKHRSAHEAGVACPGPILRFGRVTEERLIGSSPNFTARESRCGPESRVGSYERLDSSVASVLTSSSARQSMGKRAPPWDSGKRAGPA